MLAREPPALSACRGLRPSPRKPPSHQPVRPAGQFQWRWSRRATLAGVFLLTIGCSTLKTYYSEYSAPSNTGSVEEGQTFHRLPPVQRTENAADKNGPTVSRPASTLAAPENDRTRAAAEAAAA